jgi:peptidoglycan/LPS O-acetylase OafA/YrhL
VNVQNPRFPLFDSLRGIAAIMVVYIHIWFVRGGVVDSHLASKYFANFDAGVAIFFLVSGFLLYRPYVAARFARRESPPLGPYAIRRVFRIVPTYWVALLLIALWFENAAILNNPIPYFGFAQVYDRSTRLNGYGPAWTLCVEVAFYILLPLWAFLLGRTPGRTRRQLVGTETIGLALVIGASIAWNLVHEPGQLGFVSATAAAATLPAYMDQIALGMFLAVVSVALADRARVPAAIALVHRRPWLPWLFAAAAFVVLCNVGPVHDSGGEVVKHELRALFAFGLLLPAVFGDDKGGAVRRLLADRRLQWVGMISYSLYLWHVAIVYKLVSHGWIERVGIGPFMVLAAVAATVVAAASFYLIERPGLRIGRRLAGRRGYQEIDKPPPGSVDRPGAPAIELAGVDRPRA